MNDVQETQQGDIFAWRDALIAELDEESIRRKALIATKAARASWLEIGAHLTEIAYGGDYKEWGYDDFADYCQRELGLKKPTVRKMMISYQFTKQRHPDRLGDGGADLPSPDAVAALQKALEEGADERDIADVEARIFRGEVDGQEAVREVKAAYDDDQPKPKNMRRMVATMARKLREAALRCGDIPADLQEDTERVLLEVEAALH